MDIAQVVHNRIRWARRGVAFRASRAWRRAPAPLARVGYALADAVGWRYTAPRESDRCPACGSGPVQPLAPLSLRGKLDGKLAGLVTGCERCGVVFANPLPSEEALERMYSPEGIWGRPRQDDGERETRPSCVYLAKLFETAHPAFEIRHPREGSTVLDFGCGAGDLLDGLRDAGWTTYGIEPSERSAFPRHRELTSIPDSPMFDLVIAHHVLEHVRHPLEILRAMRGSLRPGGCVFVSVPRVDGLPVHRDYLYCLNSRAHIMGYTRDAMASLFAMAGLDAIDPNPPLAASSDRRSLRRLRMIGRQGAPAVPVVRPLDAARRAFAYWDGRKGTARGSRPRWMSPRAAAAILNFELGRRGRTTDAASS